MLSHVSIGVNGLAVMTAFYDRIMDILGFVHVWQDEQGVGYGPPEGGDILALFVQPGTARSPGPGCHIAFKAPSREAVDAFHAAALSMGARDGGRPGPRPHYTPTYYAAFVFDPEGYKIEFMHE